MGKTTKQPDRRKGDARKPSHAASEVPSRPFRTELAPGPACGVVSLVEAAAGGPKGGARLWLAPDTMHAVSLGPGDLIQVALAEPASMPDRGGQPSPSPVPSSAVSIGSPFASAHRSPSPSLLLAGTVSVSTRLPSADTLVPTSVWKMAMAMTDAPAEGLLGQPVQPGEFFTFCEVWPAPRLVGGTASLSESLREALQRPVPGALLLLYSKFCPDAQGQGEARTVNLTVCSVPERSSSNTAAEGEGQPVVVPLTPSPQTPGLAVTPVKPSPGRGGTPGRGTNTKEEAKPALSSSASLGAHPGEWIGQMLRKGGERQRRMLEAMAKAHLTGRVLLAGNPVLVPLLGSEILLVVSSVDGEGAPVGPSTSVALVDPNGEEATGGAGGDRPTRAAEVASVAVEAARKAALEAGVSPEAAASAAEAAATAGAKGAGVSFQCLGGVEEQMAALRRLVTLPLKSPELLAAYGVSAPGGVLLHGPPGTGKTLLARAAAEDAGATLLVVNGPDVVSEFFGESEAGLLGVWAAARALAPSVIFMDEVDAIAGGRGSGGSSSGRLVTSLMQLMDQTATQSNGGGGASGGRVVVIAATNRPEALESSLRRPGRFDSELEVGVPSPLGRYEILRATMEGLNHELYDGQVKALADSAHGYVGADLAALVDEAALQALRRQVTSARGAETRPKMVVTWADFEAAETRITPSAMREVAIEVPSVRWEDVGGQEAVKQCLREAIEWPFKRADVLARLGATPPSGVLLYGPPGCSKTLLARACASEAGLNFISIKGPELFSKWVGESEKAVAALFARARAAAPSIVFFDEVDGLAGARQDGSSGGAPSVQERVLSQLLGEMDGLTSRQGVVVVAATNRPDCVDAALLRPGRLDRLVFVAPPDDKARESIFAVHLRRTPTAPDVDICTLAIRTDHYTGADISAVCREASLAALEEDIAAEHVALRHFEAALRVVPASGPPTWAESAMYKTFERSHGSGS